MPTLYAVPTNSPDYEGGNSPIAQLSASLSEHYGIEVDLIDGAIGRVENSVFITKGSAAALTLAAPTAGLPTAGGDNGKVLRIVGTTAFAHTVTTPSNKINGNKHILTFAAVGDTAELTAYNGLWNFDAASSSVVLS